MNPAVVANATLDGVYLSVPADQWRITPRELKELAEMADGGVREAWRYNGATRELNPRKHSFGLDWEHLSGMRETIDKLLAIPGVHRLILWREEQLVWMGNGSRVEFEAPWALAIDDAPTIPSGFSESRFAPKIQVGFSGSPLTWVRKAQVDYDAAATADAGEVWWLDDERTFKLPSAPVAGAYVFGRVVPVFRVLKDVGGEKRLSDPVREPLSLELREA